MNEEKLAEIAPVLGISMEDSIREFRRFIHEMVAEENDKRQIIRVERNQKLKKNWINWHPQLIMIFQTGVVRMV